MVGSMARGRSSDRWGNILQKLKSADLELIKAEFPEYLHHNLLKAIEISFEALEPEQQKKYLQLAVFPEDIEIPEAALQTLWDVDRYDAQELIDLLVDRSLVMGGKNVLRLHDLLHDYISKKTENLKLLHRRLIDNYWKKTSGCWSSGPNDGYFFQHLAYHLMRAGKEDEFKNLYLNGQWIEAKLRNAGVSSLISELSLLSKDEKKRLKISIELVSLDLPSSNNAWIRIYLGDKYKQVFF